MDLYATDPGELKKLWKWQSRHLNGPTVPRADQPGWIPDHQKRQLEITDKICRAMDKPTLTEACKTWFAVTGRRRDGSEPFTGRLDVTPREILVAMADKEAHWSSAMKLSEILPDLEKRAAGAISPVHITYHSGCVRHHRTGHLTTIVAWPDGRLTAYSGHPMSWRASLAHSKVSSVMLYRLKITADSGALGRIVIREPLPYEQRMNQELSDNPGDLSGFAESLERNNGETMATD